MIPPWRLRYQREEELRQKKASLRVKKMRSKEIPESYYEICQYCKKDKKNVGEYRDPITRGLTCTSCGEKYETTEFLTNVVLEAWGVDLVQTINEEIGLFMHGSGEDSIFTEHDLFRLGMKEQITIGTRAVDVRYYYDPITQTQMRLIFDDDASVAVRKMTRHNFNKTSANGILLSRGYNNVAITKSDCYRRAYSMIVRDHDKLEKKRTKKDLKEDFWHQKNLAAIAAFDDLGKFEYYRTRFTKSAYRKRKLEPFKDKVDGWKKFKKRKLVDAKAELQKLIDGGANEQSIQKFKRQLNRFKSTRRHPGTSMYSYYRHLSASGYKDVKFFADALKDEEGLKNHGYAKKGKLDLKKWNYDMKEEWENAEIEGYAQMK